MWWCGGVGACVLTGAAAMYHCGAGGAELVLLLADAVLRVMIVWVWCRQMVWDHAPFVCAQP